MQTAGSEMMLNVRQCPVGGDCFQETVWQDAKSSGVVC